MGKAAWREKGCSVKHRQQPPARGCSGARSLSTALTLSLLLCCASGLSATSAPAGDSPTDASSAPAAPQVRRQIPEPFATRTMHLVRAGILDPLPASARNQREGAWRFNANLEYASIFIRQPHGTVGRPPLMLLDAEIMRFEFGLRHGITDRLTVGAGLSLTHLAGGFLDEFVTEWHDTFGLSNAGREREPANRFLATVNDRWGRNLWRARGGGIEAGNLGLWAQYNLLHMENGDEHIDLSARAWLELPTAGGSLGMGWGDFSASAGLAFGWHDHPWTFDIALDVVVPVGFERDLPAFSNSPTPPFAGSASYLHAKPYGKLLVAGSLNVWERLYAQVQVAYNSKPLETELDYDGLKDAALGSFGGRWMGDGWELTFAFNEDLLAQAEADFSVVTGLILHF